MIYNYRRELLNKLFTDGRQLKFGRGELITQTGEQDSVWFVVKGFIKRYQIGNSGNISTHTIYGPNDIFPLTYVFRALYNRRLYSGPETHYYEAMCPTSLYKLDGKTFATLVSNDHLIYKDLFAAAGDRLSSHIHNLENMGLSSSYKRVAHQLLYLAKRWGKQKTATTYVISMPVTQQDIADILSLTRETVSTALNELARNKLISKGHRRYVVHNMNKLEQEAYG